MCKWFRYYSKFLGLPLIWRQRLLAEIFFWCVVYIKGRFPYTVNVLKSYSDTKVGQTVKVYIILIFMKKPLAIGKGLNNSLYVTESENDFIKGGKRL